MKKIFLVLLVFVTACKFSKERIDNVADKNEAEQTVNKLYSSLDKNELDTAMSLFDPQGYGTAADRDRMREILTALKNMSPRLKERKLDHWNTKIVSLLRARSYYALYYINRYDSTDLKISILLKKDTSKALIIKEFRVDPDSFRQVNMNPQFPDAY